MRKMISAASSFKYCSGFLTCTTAVAAAVETKRLSRSQFEQDAGTAKKKKRKDLAGKGSTRAGFINKV